MYRPVIFALISLLIAACSTSNADTGALSLGDATRGAALFNESIGGTPICSTCHTLDGSTLVGPSLLGFAEIAATRVEG